MANHHEPGLDGSVRSVRSVQSRILSGALALEDITRGINVRKACSARAIWAWPFRIASALGPTRQPCGVAIGNWADRFSPPWQDPARVRYALRGEAGRGDLGADPIRFNARSAVDKDGGSAAIDQIYVTVEIVGQAKTLQSAPHQPDPLGQLHGFAIKPRQKTRTPRYAKEATRAVPSLRTQPGTSRFSLSGTVQAEKDPPRPGGRRRLPPDASRDRGESGR